MCVRVRMHGEPEVFEVVHACSLLGVCDQGSDNLILILGSPGLVILLGMHIAGTQ